MAGSNDFGILGVLAAGHRFGSQVNGSGSEFFAFVTFGDSAFINKDFGVTPEESLTSGLPATDLSGGYRSIGLTFVDRRYLTPHWHSIIQAGGELYSSDIKDSPISREDFEAEVSAAVVYRF